MERRRGRKKKTVSEGNALAMGKMVLSGNLKTITNAAKAIGVTRVTVYAMIERGDVMDITIDGVKFVLVQ